MNILAEILDDKRLEIAVAMKHTPVERLRAMPYYRRTPFSLHDALTRNGVAVIAEIKKASPSKGVIRHNFNHREIAREYVAGGANAISVLTDRKYFQGDVSFLSDIRPFAPVPLLRKDFIIDFYQLEEAKACGADAVLLIVSALEKSRLRELFDAASELGLECLVEVHNEQEADTLDLNLIRIVGINNRNLSDFTVDPSTTVRVAAHLPPDIVVVSESGIACREDLERLNERGIRAALVGETLMRAPRPGEVLRSLLTPVGKEQA